MTKDDRMERKLIEGLQDLDRVRGRRPARQEIERLMVETNHRLRRELWIFIAVAMMIASLTLTVFIWEPVYYVALQLIYIGGGALVWGLVLRRKRGDNHEYE